MAKATASAKRAGDYERDNPLTAAGITAVEMSCDYANQVEKIHAALYEKAMAEPGKNRTVTCYFFPVFGNTVKEKAPLECPICRSRDLSL